MEQITLEQLKQLAPWHFDVEVSPGLRTAMANSENDPIAISVDSIQKLLGKIYPDALLKNRSFLDVACNGGAYSLLARDLGACRVVGFDVREHWIKQANFLLDKLPGNKNPVSFLCRDVLEGDDFLGEELFDVCLYKGIFYHLPDPIHQLKRISERTTEVLILDTDTIQGYPDGFLKVITEKSENPMSGVHTLAWLPTGPSVLENILHWLGFKKIIVVHWLQPKNRKRGRVQIVAAKKPELLQSFDQ